MTSHYNLRPQQGSSTCLAIPTSTLDWFASCEVCSQPLKMLNSTPGTSEPTLLRVLPSPYRRELLDGSFTVSLVDSVSVYCEPIKKMERPSTE
ncbi:uncharacterized protein YALI1_D32848g [Yarrowia lipolytica]|uniref:Uncharacterized protein n=1 Tax=Yarrowia lipolytica TaxID=4952 RepID=A0A1D8NG50_YARLL|nr:hypothetical protein YALI1_D32848g [Yarrowia lipolytica]